MTHLTAAYISRVIAGDPRFDSNIELDEPGKAIVWLADGYTWNAQDGNRSVEGFIIAAQNSDNAPRDTVAHWHDCVAKITKIVPAGPTYSDGSPMKGYHATISEATGINDEAVLDRIEDCMRNDIFHSTLDWQTKEQLMEAARDAVAVLSCIPLHP